MNERDKELEDMAPKLYQWQQQASKGDVPADYFQNFEARLQRRMAAERELEPSAPSTPKQPSFWATWWQPALLAVLPAFALLLWWGSQQQGGNIALETGPTFADLSYQELDQYVTNHLDQFTSGELAAVLESETLTLLPEEEIRTTAPETASTSAEDALDKALEQTQTEDLLDELDLEELELEDDWL